MTDIIDLIDEVTAPACGQCGASLRADGPSAAFCGEDCQERWYWRHAEPATSLLDRLTPAGRAAVEAAADRLGFAGSPPPYGYATGGMVSSELRIAAPTAPAPTTAMLIGGQHHGEIIPVSTPPHSTVSMIEPPTPDCMLFNSDDLTFELLTYRLRGHSGSHWCYVDPRPAAPQRTIDASGRAPLTVDYHHHNFPCDRWWVTITGPSGGVVCELPSELLVDDDALCAWFVERGQPAATPLGRRRSRPYDPGEPWIRSPITPHRQRTTT